MTESKLHFGALEEECQACEGSGVLEDGDGLSRCTCCNGAGFVPTAFGERVIALVEHNFAALYERMVRSSRD